MQKPDRDREINKEQRRTMIYDPYDWITTDQLETELYNAIMEDSSPTTEDEDGNFAEIDDCLGAEDDDENEDQERRSLLRLLGLLRPQLAELLGGPPAEENR
jgi:hypothetical protein